MFLDLSTEVYTPVRMLFNMPLFEQALHTCWHLPSYRTQIALVTEFLKLQQQHNIPCEVTVEDMIDLLEKKNKESLRVQLWELELEHVKDKEAKPLLELVWAVIKSLRRSDVEFEARRLLEAPEDVPASMQQPKLRDLAQEYSRTLTEQLKEDPMSSLLSPLEVVVEVVPKVFHTLWEPPRNTYLNMPSQQLSPIAVGLTKAVLDLVSSALTAGEQAAFSRSIRDGVVQMIEERVRLCESPSAEVLRMKLNTFDPQMLSTITDAAASEIVKLFKPQADAEAPAAELSPPLPTSPPAEPAAVNAVASGKDVSKGPSGDSAGSAVAQVEPTSQQGGAKKQSAVQRFFSWIRKTSKRACPEGNSLL